MGPLKVGGSSSGDEEEKEGGLYTFRDNWGNWGVIVELKMLIWMLKSRAQRLGHCKGSSNASHHEIY